MLTLILENRTHHERWFTPVENYWRNRTGRDLCSPKNRTLFTIFRTIANDLCTIHKNLQFIGKTDPVLDRKLHQFILLNRWRLPQNGNKITHITTVTHLVPSPSTSQVSTVDDDGDFGGWLQLGQLAS